MLLTPPDDLYQHEVVTQAWQTRQQQLFSLGFDHAIYCTINQKQHTFQVMATQTTIPWVNHFILQQYSYHDPVIKAGQTNFSSNGLYRWDNVTETTTLISKIMSERRDYGMHSGVTISISNKWGNICAWFSLASQYTYHQLTIILKTPQLVEKMTQLHVHMLTEILTHLSDFPKAICHAIVLADYETNIYQIAELTGLSMQSLNHIYSHLYQNIRQVIFSGFDLDKKTLQHLQTLPLHQLATISSAKSPALSKRQAECLQLISKGLTAKQAAKIMQISPRTYETYIQNMLKKYQCANQKALLMKWL